MTITFNVLLVVVVTAAFMSTSALMAAYVIRYKNRARMVRASRLLNGSIDPASIDPLNPAILVDLDGCLVSVSLTPSCANDRDPSTHTYLEILTPVDGSPTPFLIVKRDDGHRIDRIIDYSFTRQFRTERTITYSEQAISWAEDLMEEHPTWIAVELNDRLLRVLSNAPELHRFTAEKIAHEARMFRSSLPDIFLVAGVGDPSIDRRYNF